MPDTTAAAIFERHHVAVFRYFRRMTGRHAVAEDLTQEVFLRVVRGLVAYEDLGRETAWLFRIARNVLVDYRRQVKDTPTMIGEADGIRVDSGHVAALGLQQALGLLSEPDREVFVLRETEGLTYAEIATACETTEQSVRSRLRRARLQLRSLLTGRLSSASLTRSREGGS